MNLYQLNSEIQYCIECGTDPETGEFNELFERELKACEMERKDQIYHVSKYLLNLESDSEAIEAEIKRLKEKKDAVDRKITRVKEYIFQALWVDEKLQFPLFSVGMRKSERLEITDDSKIPERFIRIKTTTEPDKAGLKQAIKEGAEFECAKIVKFYSLQIK